MARLSSLPVPAARAFCCCRFRSGVGAMGLDVVGETAQPVQVRSPSRPLRRPRRRPCRRLMCESATCFGESPSRLSSATVCGSSSFSPALPGSETGREDDAARTSFRVWGHLRQLLDVAELGRGTELALAIGRASGSKKETSRSLIGLPARRVPICSTTFSARAASVSSRSACARSPAAACRPPARARSPSRLPACGPVS